MIRARLRRRRAVAEAQIDYRDGLLEARAERIAELEQERDNERVAHALEVARLRYALAQAVQHAGLERYLQAGVEQARRLAEEPTAVVSTDQLRRARPAAPTEQYRRPR